MCKNPPVEAFKPFCSKRCADLDLGKWFTGSYAIPGQPAEEAEDTPTDRRSDD
jgi:endogenous inhibitor of DNA gyrase (YacG/DUF329 family)